LLRALIASFLLTCWAAQAESGYNAWLRYAPMDGVQTPAVVTTLGTAAVLTSARDELVRGLRGITGRTLRATTGSVNERAILLGTTAQLRAAHPSWTFANLRADGYQLRTVEGNVVIAANNERGVLYGVFALLERAALGDRLTNLNVQQEPAVAIRWVNHWDNLEGTIERGYGGRSIFWDNLKSRTDLSRVTDYARMLASLGINAASINNVNVNPRILASDFLPEIVRIADAMRPWGVRTAISVDFGSPQKVGGLDTFDPLDPRVIAWWKTKTDEIYRAVPDLAGFIIKADSEGRVGPSAYGRTHADATNVVARALQPHNGLIFYRGFVYDNKMDWRNLKNDRARAADDNFRKLDGSFEDNAIIQIKNGPIDFQVREPASPLFGTLQKTRKAIELQITQEYFGQAKHTVFLGQYWKDTLDFDLRVRDQAAPVKSQVQAIVGVSNVGMDENWLGNHLSQANLYAFGKLAWNPDVSARIMAEDWSRLTFGNDPKVLDVVTRIQLDSYRTFENYTGPLGLQTLTDITGNHYGVAVEASEGNGWGQWHRADEKGVGMDRSVATGTGFSGQFWPQVARAYESVEQTPDELLTFLHHMPYAHKLHSGKTVIQHLYDAHYDGAAAVEGYARDWRTLAGRVDERRYSEIQSQLDYQAGQATVWRDAVNNWFFKASGIADVRGRVGNHAGRTEAEALQLDGYTTMEPIRWESASNGKAVECRVARCEARLTFNGNAGWYKLRVQYFDQNDGAARYRVRIGEQTVDDWQATFIVPTARLDSSSSSRRTISSLALRTGDVIHIEGWPNGGELAGLDYVEVLPE
jgi:alpha-glucuronidase